MMKFLCIFAMAIVVCQAGSYEDKYSHYEKPVVGGYQYQSQPALTVKYLVPSYDKYSYGSYPSHKYYAEDKYYAPSPAYGHYGYAGVDKDALKLAYTGLAAPSAGGPIVYPNNYAYPKYETKEYNQYAAPHYSADYAPTKVTGAAAAVAASSASKSAYAPSYKASY